MSQQPPLNPDEFVITRRRKKYKFAQFANLANCFEADEWQKAKRSGEWVVEMGAGTGYFAVELAKRHPETHYVAIDVKADRLQAGARRAIEQGTANISFVRAHADQISELFAPHSVQQFWLTFSDPFPKKRSAKHRLTHPRFLKTYRELLKPGGKLAQKTDNHALFDWSLEQFVSEKWQILELTYDLHDSNLPEDYKILTTFEARFKEQGLPIYYALVSTR